MIIRDAVAEDSESLSEIYRYYVEETAISFELTAPDKDEMERRRKEYSESFPFLIAEDGGKILGYAYAHPFSQREAYSKSVEVTIYLDRMSTGKGIGKALYEALEEKLKVKGIRNLYAIVMYPGYGSVEFHERMGYRLVGKLTNCGEKFGKLWSVVYMEKFL